MPIHSPRPNDHHVPSIRGRGPSRLSMPRANPVWRRSMCMRYRPQGLRMQARSSTVPQASTPHPVVQHQERSEKAVTMCLKRYFEVAYFHDMPARAHTGGQCHNESFLRQQVLNNNKVRGSALTYLPRLGRRSPQLGRRGLLQQCPSTQRCQYPRSRQLPLLLGPTHPTSCASPCSRFVPPGFRLILSPAAWKGRSASC